MLKGRRSVAEFLKDKEAKETKNYMPERKRLVVANPEKKIRVDLRSDVKSKLDRLLSSIYGLHLYSTQANQLFNDWFNESKGWVANGIRGVGDTYWLRRSTKTLNSYCNWLEKNYQPKSREYENN
jgi:hypothetical protein